MRLLTYACECNYTCVLALYAHFILLSLTTMWTDTEQFQELFGNQGLVQECG